MMMSQPVPRIAVLLREDRSLLRQGEEALMLMRAAEAAGAA